MDSKTVKGIIHHGWILLSTGDVGSTSRTSQFPQQAYTNEIPERTPVAPLSCLRWFAYVVKLLDNINRRALFITESPVDVVFEAARAGTGGSFVALDIVGECVGLEVAVGEDLFNAHCHDKMKVTMRSSNCALTDKLTVLGETVVEIDPNNDGEKCPSEEDDRAGRG